MIRNHTDLINYLAQGINAKSYLEVGVFNTTHNFDHINIEEKTGVDPAVSADRVLKLTSDQYFALLDDKKLFDIIFIDGLHHSDQVKKDFENAMKHLDTAGFIVMHDCNPPSLATTCVPRGAQREWCGDVYKFACTIREYPDINFMTVNFDYGCTVVWKEFGVKPGKKVGKVTWQRFVRERGALLNLISPHDFIDLMPFEQSKPNEIEA